jgi:hypothetical protein
MLTTQRVFAFYWLPVLLLLSGVVVWLGDINWWDDPVISPSLASPIRMLHSLLGFGLLMLFGTVYWHSKVHWHHSSVSKKRTGIAIWGLLGVLMFSALALLYSEEDWHGVAVLAHGIAGGLLILFILGHRKIRKI